MWFVNCQISHFHTFVSMWLWLWSCTTASQMTQIVWDFFFSFFNGCLVWVVSFSWGLWSLALYEAQIVPLSCLVNCLYNYMNNLLTISSFALCSMHLILGRNFFFFLKGRVTSYPSRVGSRVNPFLLRFKKKKKKIEFGSGRVRKFWPVLPCLVFAFAKPKWLGSGVLDRKSVV